jgi:hypothetical protein
MRERNLEGDYGVCCWADVHLGRIAKSSEQGLLDLWNAAPVQAFRRAMRDGQHRALCSTHCPVLAGRPGYGQRLHDYGDEYETFSAEFRQNRERLMAAIRAGNICLDTYPLRLKLHPSNTCNLKCRMCTLDQGKRAVLGTAYLSSVFALLPYLEELIVFGGEPFACANSRQIMFSHPLRQNRQVHLSTITNGVLLDAQVLERLRPLRLGGFDFSLDSCEEQTYRQIRVNADYGKMLANLDRFIRMRDAGQLRIRRVAVTFVIQRLNFAEISAFVEFAHARRVTPAFALVAGSDELLDRIGEVQACMEAGIEKARAVGDSSAAENLASLVEMLPAYTKALRGYGLAYRLLGTGRARRFVSDFFTNHPRLKRAVRALLVGLERSKPIGPTVALPEATSETPPASCQSRV